MIPIGACLIGYVEIIDKGILRGNGALGYEGRSVSPARTVLEDPMPMLKENVRTSSKNKSESEYIQCWYSSTWCYPLKSR